MASPSACGSPTGTATARCGRPVRDVSDRRADHRDARRRCLERDDARRFMTRGQHEQIGRAVEAGELAARHHAMEGHVTIQLQPPHRVMDGAVHRVLAGEVKGDIADAIDDAPEGFDERAVILHRIQARDVQQPPRWSRPPPDRRP